MTLKNDHALISASASIPASQERVYSVIADYRNGHPRILPPQFSDLTVERGGVGAGTVIRFQMRLLGKTQSFRATVSEPDPGRLISETYTEPKPGVTSFRVERGPSAGESRVTIMSEFPRRGGLLGALEERFTRWLLLPIYTRELELLSEFVTAHSVV